MKPGTGKFLLVSLLLVCGAMLGWQRFVGEKLRAETAMVHEQAREAARLRDENRRLAGEQVSVAELDALRADHATVLRLRGEIDELEAREKAASVAATKEPMLVNPRPAPPETQLAPGMIPATAWKNAGRATPEAALETALWAAAGGDMNILAETVYLPPSTRAKLEAAMAGLPETLRQQYGTPEKLVALLAAKEMPLGAMEVLGPWEGKDINFPPDMIGLRVKLAGLPGGPQGSYSTSKSTVLVLKQTAGEWRLDIPTGVIDRYVGMLAAPPAQSSAAP